MNELPYSDTFGQVNTFLEANMFLFLERRGLIEIFSQDAISIRIQRKNAVQLPVHPQPHLHSRVSSSLQSCSL